MTRRTSPTAATALTVNLAAGTAAGASAPVLPASIDFASLDGTNGFIINGVAAGDTSGRSVSNAGDVNGDGFADIIIGVAGAAPGGLTLAGESYVVFGGADGFAPSLDLGALDGTDGFAIAGLAIADTSGSAVSSAGDINGDGIDDFLIASPLSAAYNAGEVHVVFGGAGIGAGGTFDLSTLNGTNGFNLVGQFGSSSGQTGLGTSVAAAGD